MAKKFAHEQAYRGEDLLEKLADKMVTICGAGALGSNLADSLSRQGVKLLRVIDMDRVEIHNINTQVYGESDVGAKKVNSLKNLIFSNTGTEIEIHDKELTESNVKKFLKKSNIVVDTFDNSKSRKIVHEYCLTKNVPCLHLGLSMGYGECIWNDKYVVPNDNDDIVDVCEYPLARNLITLLVSIGAEEIMRFCLSDGTCQNWCLTIKDMKISPLFTSYRA